MSSWFFRRIVFRGIFLYSEVKTPAYAGYFAGILFPWRHVANCGSVVPALRVAGSLQALMPCCLTRCSDKRRLKPLLLRAVMGDRQP